MDDRYYKLSGDELRAILTGLTLLYEELEDFDKYGRVLFNKLDNASEVILLE